MKINSRMELSCGQGSASGTGSPGSQGLGPGNLGREPWLRLRKKSGTGTGTQIRNLRDSIMSRGLKKPGLKILRDTFPVPCRPLHVVMGVLKLENQINAVKLMKTKNWPTGFVFDWTIKIKNNEISLNNLLARFVFSHDNFHSIKVL